MEPTLKGVIIDLCWCVLVNTEVLLTYVSVLVEVVVGELEFVE